MCGLPFNTDSSAHKTWQTSFLFLNPLQIQNLKRKKWGDMTYYVPPAWKSGGTRSPCPPPNCAHAHHHTTTQPHNHTTTHPHNHTIQTGTTEERHRFISEDYKTSFQRLERMRVKVTEQFMKPPNGMVWLTYLLIGYKKTCEAAEMWKKTLTEQLYLTEILVVHFERQYGMCLQNESFVMLELHCFIPLRIYAEGRACTL